MPTALLFDKSDIFALPIAGSRCQFPLEALCEVLRLRWCQSPIFHNSVADDSRLSPGSLQHTIKASKLLVLRKLRHPFIDFDSFFEPCSVFRAHACECIGFRHGSVLLCALR